MRMTPPSLPEPALVGLEHVDIECVPSSGTAYERRPGSQDVRTSGGAWPRQNQLPAQERTSSGSVPSGSVKLTS